MLIFFFFLVSSIIFEKIVVDGREGKQRVKVI